MARRKKSRGGWLGILVCFILIISGLPYIAILGGFVLLIKLIIKLINREKSINTVSQNTKNNEIRASIFSGRDSIRIKYYPDPNKVLPEVDRQIKEVLKRRVNIKKNINTLTKQIAKHNTIFNRNIEKHISIRTSLENEKRIQKNRLNAAVYVFNESSTSNFERMKAALTKLDKARYKTYDSSPALNSLFYYYDSIGADMDYIKFDVEPICISIADKIFCLTPHYIVEFSQRGKYLTTYKPSTFIAGLSNGSWTEKVANKTWLHTRVDGSPDRRYSYNPEQTYYTNVTHTIYNMLDLRIPGFEVKYEIDDLLKNEVVQSVRAYATTVVMDSYDPVYHITRLLKMCEPLNTNILNIEVVIEA